jgi:hypothetical protein
MTRPSRHEKTCVLKDRFPDISVILHGAKKLDQSNFAGLCRVSCQFGFMDQMRPYDPIYNTQYPAHHLVPIMGGSW